VIYMNEIIKISLLSYMLQSSLLCKDCRSMVILLNLNIRVGQMPVNFVIALNYFSVHFHRNKMPVKS
jgi:hypothetical protein